MATFDQVWKYLLRVSGIALQYSTNPTVYFAATADRCKKGGNAGKPIIRVRSGKRTNILIYPDDWGQPYSVSGAGGTRLKHIYDALNPFVDAQRCFLHSSSELWSEKTMRTPRSLGDARKKPMSTPSTTPSLMIDREKGKEIAETLYHAFTTTGILGHTEMPEDVMPTGAKRGSLEHLLFITLTVAIDYQRDANTLWTVSRRTFDDPETRYLYDPESLHKTRLNKIVKDMQKHGLSKKPKKDPNIWRTVGVTFYKKWGGDPRRFLADCRWDSPTILKRLENDYHLYNRRSVADYPYLRGNKIGPLWLRMLRDNVGVKKLKNLEQVPIPVDIHVARATLATGVVRGQYSGKLTDLFEHIRRAWFESVQGLPVKKRPMIALDVDEALWHLSKYGCTDRDKTSGHCPVSHECEASKFCIKGKININIKRGQVELDT